jgi:hypothetical protein
LHWGKYHGGVWAFTEQRKKERELWKRAQGGGGGVV